MKQEDIDRNLASAEAVISRAAKLLVSPTPEALDTSATLLDHACRQLQNVTQATSLSGPGGRTHMESRLRRLGRSTVRLSGMLDQAAGYWAGWVRLRNSMTGGYTAQGDAAAPAQNGRLSLEA